MGCRSNCGEVVYEDHTMMSGRTVYRCLACGRKVDKEDAGPVVPVDNPPLSAYFSFRGRK